MDAAAKDADTNFGQGAVGETVEPCSHPTVAFAVPADALDEENPPGGTPPGNLLVVFINDEDQSKIPKSVVTISGSIVDSGSTGDPSGEKLFRGVPSGPYTVGHKDKCFLPKTEPGTVQAGQTTRVELKVTPVHAAITIKELAFSGNNTIEKDTAGDFVAPDWVQGRAQSDQNPVAYVRNTKIAFTAKFRVTSVPCHDEIVEVKGNATFGSVSMEWAGTATVKGGASDTSVSLTSNNALPDEVGVFESSTISWQMKPVNSGWAPAGSSLNAVYATLGSPSGTKNFWTLLDVSCRAAAGQKTESDVITKSFGALASRAITRKRDGRGLQYWITPATDCRAFNTQLILAAANGAGQCGAWAEFMIDMYKVHGITSADKILIERNSGHTEGFIIKAWTFDHPPASQASAFTHWRPSQARPAARVPAQRNSDSPEHFANHFIVLALGKFWDPSYGNGPFADQTAWEAASIDGLFRNPPSGSSPPSGTTEQIGWDKSLNTGTKMLILTNLTTGNVIP